MICIWLFIGAMGKSAQFPLHVWLPDSMEGPTPISALIHAATMVTAGIFMVARMSPLFELSDTALSFVHRHRRDHRASSWRLLGVVQNDIKRVVAYSTLSQLGYMTVALGASAYSAAIFHLMTHAFFKALLFLAAGSVIIALHHEQDMRKMGGLRKYMPITYWTALIGSLALCRHAAVRRLLLQGRDHRGGAPLDTCRGARTRTSRWPSACSSPALYSFRMMFLTFHGEERFRARGRRTDEHAAHDADHARAMPHESAVGGDGAAGPAGDPVGLRGLGVRRPRALRRLLRRRDRHRAARMTGSAKMAEELHGVVGVRDARPRHAAVLARAGRHRHGLVLLHRAARAAGGDLRGTLPAGFIRCS